MLATGESAKGNGPQITDLSLVCIVYSQNAAEGRGSHRAVTENNCKQHSSKANEATDAPANLTLARARRFS